MIVTGSSRLVRCTVLSVQLAPENINVLTCLNPVPLPMTAFERLLTPAVDPVRMTGRNLSAPINHVMSFPDTVTT